MSAGGVWRTISGRRVFIKKGQSLTEAMEQSGKFKELDVKDKLKLQKLKKELDERVENHPNLKGRERLDNIKRRMELEKEIGELDGSTDRERVKRLENHDITIEQSRILENMGVDGKPNIDQIEMAIEYGESIKAYSGSKYTQIRDVNNQSKDIVAIRENINEFIDISPKFKGETYRGLSFSDDKDYNDFIGSLKPGSEIEMNGISSWTSKESIAKEFASQSKHKIMLVNKNVHKGVEIEKLSVWKGENEVLFGSSATFKYIDKYMGKDGMIYIYV